MSKTGNSPGGSTRPISLEPVAQRRRAPEVVDPEKAALEKVGAEALHLRLVEADRAGVLHEQHAAAGEQRIGQLDDDVMRLAVLVELRATRASARPGGPRSCCRRRDSRCPSPGRSPRTARCCRSRGSRGTSRRSLRPAPSAATGGCGRRRPRSAARRPPSRSPAQAPLPSARGPGGTACGQYVERRRADQDPFRAPAGASVGRLRQARQVAPCDSCDSRARRRGRSIASSRKSALSGLASARPSNPVRISPPDRWTGRPTRIVSELVREHAAERPPAHRVGGASGPLRDRPAVDLAVLQQCLDRLHGDPKRRLEPVVALEDDRTQAGRVRRGRAIERRHELHGDPHVDGAPAAPDRGG